MRLFIAINFTPAFKQDLVDMQSALQHGGVSGNFTRAENLHMTLAFIGDFGDPDRVLDVMESVWFKPIRIELDGLQPFRDMFFAKIADNRALASFVRRLRRALAEAGIPFDRKKFSPHITLVRRAVISAGMSASGRREAGVAGAASGRREAGADGADSERRENGASANAPALPDDLPCGAMLADRVSLMLSERGRHGMVYTELGGIE